MRFVWLDAKRKAIPLRFIHLALGPRSGDAPFIAGVLNEMEI